MATLDVITGPMFCGKTEELIRRGRRAHHGGQSVLRLVPGADTRSAGQFKSHAGRTEPAWTLVAGDLDFLSKVRDAQADIVLLDEAQMLGRQVVRYVQQLVRLGTGVTVAGLNRDYRGQPFDTVAELLSLADSVTTLTSVCVACKKDATHTHRLGGSEERQVVGGAELYEPRCRVCWLQVVRDPWLAV